MSTEVADFLVITDGLLTLPNANDGNNRDFTFTLDHPTNPAILSWVMGPSSPSGAATYSFKLNGTEVIKLQTPPDSGRRAMYEVANPATVVNGQNTLTLDWVVPPSPANSNVLISDIVLWFHRQV
jgi:hypothetical protein